MYNALPVAVCNGGKTPAKEFTNVRTSMETSRPDSRAVVTFRLRDIVAEQRVVLCRDQISEVKKHAFNLWSSNCAVLCPEMLLGSEGDEGCTNHTTQGVKS